MKRLVYVAVLAAALCMTIQAMAQVNQEAGGAGPDDEAKETLFSLIVKGGPVMIPLGLCSIIGLSLAVERMIVLSRERVLPPNFIDGLRGAMGDGEEEGVRKAISFCEESQTPVGRIFEAGLMSLPLGPSGVEKSIEDAGGREINKMRRSINGLAVLGSIAPLLGLLGTVYGLISVFQTASVGGMGKADMLAKGIYEALVTTATGLTIAIPIVLAYQYLNSKISGIVDEIDEMGMVFMASCIHKTQAPPKG